MKEYQRQFIEFVIEYEALRFGQFTLKSGRISPYFFNAGQIRTGKALAKLGHFYASAIMDAKLNYDVLFGPAYKGIPLVTTAATALYNEFQIDKPLCFNRKEVKDHGEGGNLIGAPLTGNVLLIDDVITAGTAVRESMTLIEANHAKLTAIVIALDRQERGTQENSALDELRQQYQCSITAIVSLCDIIDYLSEQPQKQEEIAQLRDYQARYGAAAVSC